MSHDRPQFASGDLMPGIVRRMPDEFEDESGSLSEPPGFFPYRGEAMPGEPVDYGEPVRVTIEGVFATETNGSISHFVLLSDSQQQKLPITIGPYEAHAISSALEGVQPDRPMAHDLMRNLVEKLGASVERVVIDDIWNDTYYAKLFLQVCDEEIEVDSRPSDAIALAVRFQSPIFVSEGMLTSLE